MILAFAASKMQTKRIFCQFRIKFCNFSSWNALYQITAKAAWERKSLRLNLNVVMNGNKTSLGWSRATGVFFYFYFNLLTHSVWCWAWGVGEL